MQVKSVEITKLRRCPAEEHHGLTFWHMSVDGAADGSHVGLYLAECLEMEPGRTYTLIAVENPPKPEPEVKECRRLSRTQAYTKPVCEGCGHSVDKDAPHCPNCHSRFTHTITWAEFTQRDC